MWMKSHAHQASSPKLHAAGEYGDRGFMTIVASEPRSW
jgi:hypothetical protein